MGVSPPPTEETVDRARLCALDVGLLPRQVQVLEDYLSDALQKKSEKLGNKFGPSTVAYIAFP